MFNPAKIVDPENGPFPDYVNVSTLANFIKYIHTKPVKKAMVWLEKSMFQRRTASFLCNALGFFKKGH